MNDERMYERKAYDFFLFYSTDKAHFVQKSIYFNVRPSLLENWCDGPITAELAFADVYVRDGVPNNFRQAACIFDGKHCSVNVFMSP